MPFYTVEVPCWIVTDTLNFNTTGRNSLAREEKKGSKRSNLLFRWGQKTTIFIQQFHQKGHARKAWVASIWDTYFCVEVSRIMAQIVNESLYGVNEAERYTRMKQMWSLATWERKQYSAWLLMYLHGIDQWSVPIVLLFRAVMLNTAMWWSCFV